MTVFNKIKGKKITGRTKKSVIGIALLISSALMLAGCSDKSAAGEETAAQENVAEEGANTGQDTAKAEASEEKAGDTTGDNSGESGENMSQSEYLQTVFKTFTAEDFSGNEVTEEIYKNAEVTMINLWGTFCGPCINEMPELAELSEELKEEGKAQIVGIVLDTMTVNEDDEVVSDETMVEKAKEIVGKAGVSYTNLLPTGDFAIGLVTSGVAQYVPTSIFVDSEGNIVGEPLVGARDKGAWKEEIDKKLEEAKN